MRVERFPGGSVVRGTPLGRAWALDGSGLADDVLDRLSACVAKAVGAGRERTAAQDVGYGLQQVTDVVVKALSPGVNDPTTAVHALGHSSALLCEALEYRLGPKLLRDEQGRVRVVLARPHLDDLLDGALAQPRRYGGRRAGCPVAAGGAPAGGRLAGPGRRRAPGRPRAAGAPAGDRGRAGPRDRGTCRARGGPGGGGGRAARPLVLRPCSSGQRS